MFECAANGSESLTISWIRNNNLISNLKSNRIQNDGNKSVLEIKEAKVDDSGIYQCIATNADNEEISSKPAELLSKISRHTVVCQQPRKPCDAQVCYLQEPLTHRFQPLVSL